MPNKDTGYCETDRLVITNGPKTELVLCGSNIQHSKKLNILYERAIHFAITLGAYFIILRRRGVDSYRLRIISIIERQLREFKLRFMLTRWKSNKRYHPPHHPYIVSPWLNYKINLWFVSLLNPRRIIITDKIDIFFF